VKAIKLMADYHCFPIWDMTPGGYRDVAPGELPISKELQRRLLSWASSYDETLDADYPPSSGFKSDVDESNFRREAESLLKCLRAELGPDVDISYT